MKIFRFIALLLFTVFVFAACNTTQNFTIETQMPAEVTFPVPSPRVVLANNAVIQPPKSGVELMYGKTHQAGYSLLKDSAHWACINYLGKELYDSNYFDDVLIYNYTLREDDSYLSTQPIAPNQITDITEDADADALISIDRLLFNVSQTILGNEYPFVSIEVTCRADFSVYLPGQSAPIASFSVADSLKFNDFVNNDSLLVYQHIPLNLLNRSASFIAEAATRKLAPYWEQSNRTIYSGIDSKMKQAFAYCKRNRWEEAVAIWENVYQYDKNQKKRGRAAINMAFSNELNDQYETALEWVNKALKAYDTQKPSGIQAEKEFALQYQEILRKRKETSEK